MIAAAFLAVCMPLAAQLIRLQVVDGAANLAEAEQALVRHEVLPTVRGTIRDRHGRILAVDRPVYALALEYTFIDGTWVEREARRGAIREAGRRRWAGMEPDARRVLLDAHRAAREAEREALLDEIAAMADIPRDVIDAQVAAVVRRVEALAGQVHARQRDLERSRRGDEAAAAFRPDPIREQRQPHEIHAPLPDDRAFLLRALERERPGILRIIDTHRREYPWLDAEVLLDRTSLPGLLRAGRPAFVRVQGVADHLLGQMRPAWAEDVARRPMRDATNGEIIDLGGYGISGDVIGSAGLERSLEDVLRGQRGEARWRVDSDGISRVDPVPGQDIDLTIDVALQSRVQAILSPAFGLCQVQPWHDNPALPPGTPLAAAVVILEVSTGEILAMASSPSRADAADMDAAAQRLRSPWINRPAEAIYPPGSIVKPLILVGAVTDGVHALTEPIVCTGHFFRDQPEAARCWIYRAHFGFETHGALRAEEALARSCNIFFYALADRLGNRGVVEWLGWFGTGRHIAPDLAWRESPRAAWTGAVAGSLPPAGRGGRFETILLGIGQGPVAWTPLHAANAYAQLARGGLVRDPVIVRGTPPRDWSGGAPAEADGATPRADRRLDPAAVAAALRGLRDSVRERYGTSHHIRPGDDRAEEVLFPPGAVEVFAKTGTAQAPPWDRDGDGVLSETERATTPDHAWFVGLVGPTGGAPLHAIAVIVEHGGSGGRVAGPVAAQVIRALQRERYLPDGGTSP